MSRPVLVCGAGAAGMAAAIAAAQAGRSVMLVEASARVGGTVADCLIHTIGGLFDDRGELLNPGLPTELLDSLQHASPSTSKRRIGRTWVLDADPEIYREVASRWLTEAGVQALLGSRIAHIEKAGQRVELVRIEQGESTRDFEPSAVIDATGTAEVIRRVDAGLIQPSGSHMAGGLILRARGIEPGAMRPPRNVAVVRALRSAVADGRLPAICSHTWIDTGMDAGEVFVKLAVSIPEDWRSRVEELTREASGAGEAVVRFLRTCAGFENVHVFQIGKLGVREGGRACGEYKLTGDDVRSCRRFPDAACRGAWPVEVWNAATGVSLEYLPPGGSYDIPLRSLKVAGVHNLWVAGKCLSADEAAQASARIAGCCWAMGEAAGRAAAE